MIWPAMLFNLCVGLLLAGYLLRGVRRFERRADAVMAKLDARHAARMARLDAWADAEEAKYDIARNEIRASMRAQFDAAIAEMTATQGNRSSGQIAVVRVPTTLRFTAIAKAVPTNVPTEEEIRELSQWARVAFAARCARRVLPLSESNSTAVSQFHFAEVRAAVERAEANAATDRVPCNDQEVAIDADGSSSAAAAAVAAFSAAAQDAGSAVRNAIKAAELHGRDTHPNAYATFSNDADKAGAAESRRIAADIRRDFEVIRSLGVIKEMPYSGPVRPSEFGPLWSEGPPEGWPKLEKPATELCFRFDVPDDMTTAEAVEFAKGLSAALCELHLAGGGHGLAIQPPVELTAPVRVRVPV